MLEDTDNTGTAQKEFWETLEPLAVVRYKTSWLETEALLAAVEDGGDPEYLDQVVLRMPPYQRAILRNTADRLSRSLSPNRLQNLEKAAKEGLTYQEWFDKYN